MKNLLLCILVSFTIGISIYTITVFNLETSLFSTAIIPAVILISILYYFDCLGHKLNYVNVFLFRVLLFFVNIFVAFTTFTYLDFDFRDENYFLLDDEIDVSDGDYSGTYSTYRFYLDVSSSKKKILTDEGYLLRDRSNNWAFYYDDSALEVNQGYVQEKEIAVMQEYINAETMVNDTNPLLYGVAVIKEYVYKQGIYDLIFGIIIFLISSFSPSTIFGRNNNNKSDDPSSSYD